MAWKSKPPKGYIGLNTGFAVNDEELKWQKFCIDNGIIISPEPTSKGMYPQEWRIAVSFMPNFKKVYKTPTVYITDNIWQETFKTMKYYYDKKHSR